MQSSVGCLCVCVCVLRGVSQKTVAQISMLLDNRLVTMVTGTLLMRLNATMYHKKRNFYEK